MGPQKPIVVGEILELEIDSLSYGGGRGVGRSDGFVVFVPYSAPGDLLKVRVTTAKKNFLEAEVVEILKPSTARRKPPCPVFGECGGCSLQHVTYENQLLEKQKYIERALRGKTKALNSIRPSEKEFHYRNRIQLQRKGDSLGFLKRGSNQMVAIKECFIAEPELNRAIQEKGFWSHIREERLELAQTTDGKVVVRAKGNLDPEQSLFSQVNALQNEALLQVVVSGALKACKSHNIINFFDLYAGSGNLTFPLYHSLHLPGVGVELSQNSVELAQRQVKREGLESFLNFHSSSVEVFLNKIEPCPQSLVVLDPPREGLTAKVISQLKRLGPPSIILVGCHLMNFSRDLDRLKSLGYQTEEVSPIDMFPQTDHVELVAFLERS